MDISVVIVSWNARQHLEECLKTLAEETVSRSVEVIVVDNASSDGSPEMVEARFPQVRLIRNNANLGFAKANNIGIREAKGRYVSLINSDVQVLDDCLDALANFLEHESHVGVVGPRIRNSDMTLQSSCRGFPTIWNNFCAASGLAQLKGLELFSGEHMFYFPHDRVLDVDVLVGCFWMIRREALEVVGLLDEDFFFYAEDVDWCRRCWDAGWRVVFFPEAHAIHHRAGSSANDPVRFAILQQKALLHYWRKHHGVSGRMAMFGLIVCKHLGRFLIATLFRLAGPSRASENRARMRVSVACLQALFLRSAARKI